MFLTTELEIIDTAVKVGLGAAISGLSAYGLAHLNHRRELAKDRVRRRQELLEGIAEQIEGFTHVVLKYWALMMEWVRYRKGGVDMPEPRRKELDDCGPELFAAYKDLSSAEAKLLLLGEVRCQQLAREYGEDVRVFRRQAWVGNSHLSEDHLSEWRQELLNLRARLFQQLSEAYRRGT